MVRDGGRGQPFCDGTGCFSFGLASFFICISVNTFRARSMDVSNETVTHGETIESVVNMLDSGWWN